MRYLTGFSMSCLLLLVGCASPQPTLYQESSAKNEFGYTETKLTDTQYRIDFVGNRFTEKSRIKDYALLRAAELTSKNGYDWFTILDSETEQETKTRQQTAMSGSTGSKVVRKCGLLGCSTYVTPYYSGVGIKTYEVEGKVSTSLQISMGSGEAKNPNVVFNAKELAKNMRNNLK
jgi:hypothetical protein